VPSVLFLLSEYVQAGVKGICIGTSDLTQLILGVDRDQGLMPNAFHQIHPAVMEAIAHLIQTANALGIPCAISSQAILQSEFIDRLVEWGITAISVNLDSIEVTQRLIARAEQRFLLKRVRDR
jgi:pyruvate,water dikinase